MGAGDIDWKNAKKQFELPYLVELVEITDVIVHTVFAISVAVKPSCLGWILFCLLLGGEIALYLRYMWYKQFMVCGVPSSVEDLTNCPRLCPTVPDAQAQSGQEPERDPVGGGDPFEEDGHWRDGHGPATWLLWKV